MSPLYQAILLIVPKMRAFSAYCGHIFTPSLPKSGRHISQVVGVFPTYWPDPQIHLQDQTHFLRSSYSLNKPPAQDRAATDSVPASSSGLDPERGCRWTYAAGVHLCISCSTQGQSWPAATPLAAVKPRLAADMDQMGRHLPACCWDSTGPASR